jgi:competence protein ComEA
MKTTRWIGVVALATWCLGGGLAAASEDRPSRTDAKAEAKVNINEASKAELMRLEGVGQAAALKIIAYREAHGPFKRPQDLAKVEGVGRAVLEKNAGRITVK